MQCPSCGAAELIQDVRDVPYAYKTQSIVIPLVSGQFCPACENAIVDRVDTDRVSAAMISAASV